MVPASNTGSHITKDTRHDDLFWHCQFVCGILEPPAVLNDSHGLRQSISAPRPITSSTIAVISIGFHQYVYSFSDYLVFIDIRISFYKFQNIIITTEINCSCISSANLGVVPL